MTRWTAISTCPTGHLTPSAVAELQPSVTYDPDRGSLTAVFELIAPTLRQATAAALRQARLLLRAKPSAITVQPTDRYQHLTDHPPAMDLLSVGDTAEVLGISATRVIQLAQTACDFPAPVARPRSGPIWTRASIDSFKMRRESQPLTVGRPRRKQSSRGRSAAE